MSWIESITPDEATGRLARIYAGACDPELGRPANVLVVHGVSPTVLEAHLALYRRVVKAPKALPWYACEMVATVVSAANACRYCTIHHAVALSRALAAAGTEAPFAFRPTVEGLVGFGRTGEAAPIAAVPAPWNAAVRFARALTVAPGAIRRPQHDALAEAGLADAARFEIVQVTAYFNYVNRVVLGLGVALEPEYEAAHGWLWPLAGGA